MNVILDTQIIIWAINSDKRIERYRQYFQDNSCKIYHSIVNIWEIQLKYQKGKLKLPSPPAVCLQPLLDQSQTPFLNIEPKHIYQLQDLPSIHQDPFDRILICQALAEDLTILTSDPLIKQYKQVKTL